MIVVVTPTDVVAVPEQQLDLVDEYRFQVNLTGVDGSQWDLTRGNVVLTPGARLFAAPTVSHWWKTSPGVDGSRWDGMRTEQQSKILPVAVLGDTWEDWRDRDAALFAAVHPAGECQVHVTAPDGRTRSIALRFVAGGDLDVDPLSTYFAAYALEMVAASPFWVGDPVVQTFTAEPPLPLFPGPAFNINRAGANDDATVTNPGDELAWPIYRIDGPASSWSVGVGGAVVASQTPITVGQSVTVDMRPDKLTVLREDGSNAYSTLTSDTFAPIPPGTDVQLTTSLNGFAATSAIRVEFTPLFRRPW